MSAALFGGAVVPVAVLWLLSPAAGLTASAVVAAVIVAEGRVRRSRSY